MSETYTPGYSANASQFMANRTAANHAAFFLPHLKPGMSVLDCGCGPGTITAGLAEAVAPGSVVGIDMSDSQIAIAQSLAAERKLANLEFKVASVYELPFEAQQFDAVFAHAVLEHLGQPQRAFGEIRRVLKPGGMAGICSPDWGGFLIAPSNPVLDASIDFYKRLQASNGGNPYVGRQLGALAQAAGFARVHMSAHYECYESLERIAEYLALRIEAVSPAEAAQIASPDTPLVPEMVASLRAFGQTGNGLFAQAWVAVIAVA